MTPSSPRALTLWVTRPSEDAADLAEMLRTRGHAILIEPLLVIERLEGPPLDLDGVQAILATSANGVRAFAYRNTQRALPLLAVGDATARAAQAAGFQHVESAAGDVAALAALVRQQLDPRAGALLHIAARDLAGDLARTLACSGFTCRRAVLYRAQAADALSKPLTRAIRDASLDGVLVFSPRTAETLVRLISDAGIAPDASRLDLFCLSAAVADRAAALRWRRVVIAAKPTQAALLDSIDAAGSACTDRLGGAKSSGPADSLSSSGGIVGTLSPRS